MSSKTFVKKPELPPLEDKRPEVSAPKVSAGGIPAIVSSMKHAIGEAGLIRGTKELLHLNQMKGFDCPGCAWPDPDDHRAPTEFCENGAKAIAEEATTERVTPEFFKQHSVHALSLLSDMDIGKSGRITHPMLLKENATHYEEVSWDDAFTIIADEINSLKSPNEAIFYTSGRTSNEAAYLYQLYTKILGTNNLPDCSNMCHESSGVGLTESIGIGKGSVTLKDFDYADTILIIGQNPGTNHPRMLTTLAEAAERGAKIVSINPLFETGLQHFQHPQHPWKWVGHGTKVACLHVPVLVNGDIALFKGVMKEMLASEEQKPGTVFNQEFIKNYTSGYDDLISSLRSTSWNDIVEQSGISRELIKELADIVMAAKNMICCWAMGITQQKDGVQCIQELVNLLLLGGHFGRPGAGACPVRGHSNVQGDRTVGIYEKPSDVFLDSLAKEFNFVPPREHGLDVVEAIKAMHRGDAKVFIGMGGNFLSATPDTEFTADALRRAQLTVHVSTKLNRSHLVHGKRALILPCLGRTEIDIQASGEQFVSVEDSMSVVHQSHGNLKPGSEFMKSEPAIVAGLAMATFRNHPSKLNIVNWPKMIENYDHIRTHIENTIPGFNKYNQRVREKGGFYLPHPVRDSLVFRTSTNKGRFVSSAMPIIKLPPNGLMLMTLRSHDQFNTTIYGPNDRYRGIKNGRRVIFMNEHDIAEQKLEDGQWVDITSHFEDERRTSEKYMIVKFDIPKRCAATYFPEANVLVPIGSVVGRSNTPAYKSIIVTVAPTVEAS
ncbi:MAG: FdhF/YdeP family oxidoreductase [Bdellovibrio sp.]|nr:FdhF/YdeP family oxidoreductase [Bdellovibrio sp.]